MRRLFFFLHSKFIYKEICFFKLGCVNTRLDVDVTKKMGYIFFSQRQITILNINLQCKRQLVFSVRAYGVRN